ncbi:unnamed protein product, partial [Nesidiocoris tenuis]
MTTSPPQRLKGRLRHRPSIRFLAIQRRQRLHHLLFRRETIFLPRSLLVPDKQRK